MIITDKIYVNDLVTLIAQRATVNWLDNLKEELIEEQERLRKRG